MKTQPRHPSFVTKFLATLILAPLLIRPACAQTVYPQFPAFDPFLNATSSGGSAYAAGTGMGQQTNAMGQIWFFIDGSATTSSAATNTGYALNYQSLPGFSGDSVLFRNVNGPGGRIFFQDSGTFPAIGAGTNLYYSAVIVVSNVSSLSTTGQYLMAFGTQSTIANQTTQPTQGGAGLWIRQVNTTNFELGISGLLSKTATYYTTALLTNTVYFVVCDDEYPSGNCNLWIDPATNSFGAPTEPASLAVGTGGTLGTLSCAQIYEQTGTANALYLTDFRVGSNWGWATGGPAIAFPLAAATNTPTGTLDLSITAMNNGSANSFNWQLDGTNLSDGASISGSGATVSGSQTAALAITGMDTSAAQKDAGGYTVVVSNSWGAVTSSVCAVTAYSAPVVTVQPSPTNIILFAGETNNLSLTAVGFSLSYNWFSNGTYVPAFTSSSFSIPDVQQAAAIYCIVSNSIGTATSAVVSLTVVADPTYPYPAKVFADHPIGFWPLNEGPDNNNGNDGTTAYDYLSANNGYYTNANLDLGGYGTGLAAEFGYTPATDPATSAEFGSYANPNSYVAQIPNINFASVNAATSFSVEAWVNCNGSIESAGSCVVGKGYGGGGEQFTMDYDAGWRFFIREAGSTTVQAVSSSITFDTNWHHLAGVLDTVNSNITIYVDGQSKASTSYTASTGILASTNDMTIGSRMSSATSAFNDNFLGEIQDVAVYNYALTAAQVANHYNAAGIGPTATVTNEVTVNEGTTLTLPAVVTGTPTLSNQWVDATANASIAGQTNGTLVISNISAAAYNGHDLDIVVSNAYGATTSGLVVVQVLSGAPNSVTIDPPSLALYAGLPATFSVTANNSEPFYYQWSTNGVDVTGATNSAYSPSLPPGAYTIGCAVTNIYGPGSPPVATASYTVVATPSDYYGSTILAAGPVAFWRLDEPANATTAFDYVGGHNATYNNAVNGASGFSATDPAETATIFGTNGSLPSYAEEINNSANGTSLVNFSTAGNAEFSAEAWVQSPLESTGDYLGKGYPNNTQFAFDGGGTSGAFRFVVHNGSDTIADVSSGSALPDGNWHFLVGTCDEANGQITIYVDGVVKGTGTITKNSGLLTLSGTYPVVIGAQIGSGGSGYTSITNCAMSQVALYNFVLTATEVSNHFAAASGLPALSPFNITSWSVVDGTSITLNWASVAGHTYQVQVAPALGGPTNSWVHVGSPIVASGTNISYTDSSTNATARTGYYRVVGD